VDTNILIHVLKRSALGVHLIEAGQFRSRASTPMMCVVSEAELLALAARNGWGQQKRERLEELLNELVIVDVRADARALLTRYAALDVFSHSQGKKMGKNDLWIAAAAAESDSLLLTTDHDFDHLSPTQLKVWWLDPDATSWPSVPL
jgi:predicted nucleic acid-binding protein